MYLLKRINSINKELKKTKKPTNIKCLINHTIKQLWKQTSSNLKNQNTDKQW